MNITFRPMTADEAWQYIESAYSYYRDNLNAFKYEYKKWIPDNPELQEMFDSPRLTPKKRAKYRDIFVDHIYNEQKLHCMDSFLETVAVPKLRHDAATLAPLAEKWGIKIPDEIEILTTYGVGCAYCSGKNPKIAFRMTRISEKYAPRQLLHNFILLLIDDPILQKYNVPRELKERIVDVIGFEYFGYPTQLEFDNSFANNYIKRATIENDLPGAVQKMMADYNILTPRQRSRLKDVTNPIHFLPDIIETPRLTMRRLSPTIANAQKVFDAIKDENPNDFYFNPIGMTSPIPQDVDETLYRMKRIKKYSAQNGTWYYIFHNGELIGFRRFYFFNDPRKTFQTAEAWLVRRAWGKGFARETYEVFEKIAFEMLDAKRITRQCDTANIRSANSIHASGFHLDGIARGGGLHQDGTVYDNMLWSKLRIEYK